jgi:hypothetical protein
MKTALAGVLIARIGRYRRPASREQGGERRGRDSNPRRTQRPETVFETAAFVRSATPPDVRLRREAEKEGFEPSKEVITPLTP